MKRLDGPEIVEKMLRLVSSIFYFQIPNDILVKFIHWWQWEKHYKMMKMMWNDYGMIILICCCRLIWVPVVVSLCSFKSLCLQTLWTSKGDNVEGSYSGEGYSGGSGGVYSGGDGHGGSAYTGGDGLYSEGYTGDVSYGGCSAYGDGTVDGTKKKGCDTKKNHRKASVKKGGDGDKGLLIEKKEWLQKSNYITSMTILHSLEIKVDWISN